MAEMPSCRDCPSFMTSDDARVEYRREVGSPVCRLHGHVLGKPDLSLAAVESVCEAFADNCEQWGRDFDPINKTKVPIAVVGTADARVWAAGRMGAETTLSSCRSCANYVPEEVVKVELGWHLPICAASGRLLFPNRLTVEPKECGYGTMGANRSTTEGWMELDHKYKEAFSFGGASVRVTGESAIDLSAYGDSFVEPGDYVTDKEVTVDERAEGIRAWRKIVNPNDPSLYTHLPIFDPMFFDEVERSKIPTSRDDEHPELYVDHQCLVYTAAVESMELEETLALWGDAGTGKTEFARHLAYMMQLPFYRISITRSTELDDLAGKWLFVDSETRWTDGRVTRSWGRPCVQLTDEPNVGPDDVWHFYRPLMDNSTQLVLDMKDGERRERNNWCFPLLAMNPAWDPKNIGTNEISDADGTRMSNLFMQLPPENVERAILARRCQIDGYDIPVDKLETIMSIAVDLRAMIANGGLTISWGLRPQIAVARKTKWYDLETAYRRAILDRLEPSTAEMVVGVIKDYVA